MRRSLTFQPGALRALAPRDSRLAGISPWQRISGAELTTLDLCCKGIDEISAGWCMISFRLLNNMHPHHPTDWRLELFGQEEMKKSNVRSPFPLSPSLLRTMLSPPYSTSDSRPRAPHRAPTSFPLLILRCCTKKSSSKFHIDNGASLTIYNSIPCLTVPEHNNYPDTSDFKTIANHFCPLWELLIRSLLLVPPMHEVGLTYEDFISILYSLHGPQLDREFGSESRYVGSQWNAGVTPLWKWIGFSLSTSEEFQGEILCLLLDIVRQYNLSLINA